MLTDYIDNALSLDGGLRANPAMFNEALRHCERLAKHDCLICIISDGFGHDHVGPAIASTATTEPIIVRLRGRGTRTRTKTSGSEGRVSPGTPIHGKLVRRNIGTATLRPPPNVRTRSRRRWCIQPRQCLANAWEI